MTSATSLEQRFVAGASDLKWSRRDMHSAMRSLDDWFSRLSSDFAEAPLHAAGLTSTSALARDAVDVRGLLAARVRDWSTQRDGLSAAQAVADAFEQKAIFLVFGKFNTGKSSLCNFLGERFASHGLVPRFFRIEAGKIVERGRRFAEGATETTTALQGVFLGTSLVLLDTPGLHSVTTENAELTRRITDSADGVLWLTSSASPGQVQELDDLARELHRAKPLLPVITRSDFLDEDEVDGEIVKVLRNKTPANRAMQEADVHHRGAEKLERMGVERTLLKAPVSLSVHAARENGAVAEAMRNAGFDAFWAAFLALVEPAVAYKRRKAAEIVLHHGEERVVGDLDADVLPRLDSLRKALIMERDELGRRQATLTRRVWRTVMPEMPAMLELHAPDAGAVRQQASTLLDEAFADECRTELEAYELVPAPRIHPHDLAQEADYERVCLDGDADGVAVCVERSHVHAGCELGHERLHAALESSIRSALDEMAADTIRQCRRRLDALLAEVDDVVYRANGYRTELNAIKQAIRSEQPSPSGIPGPETTKDS